VDQTTNVNKLNERMRVLVFVGYEKLFDNKNGNQKIQHLE